MYKLEITTNDNKELLLFEEYLDTWKEVKEEIDFFKSIDFDNINLIIYKKSKEKELEYLGEFYHITPKEQTEIIKNKNTLTRKIILLEILLFPIMLLKEILKEQ